MERRGFFRSLAAVAAVLVGARSAPAAFRRTPIRWVPQLEADTTRPVYGIEYWLVKKPSKPLTPAQQSLLRDYLRKARADMALLGFKPPQ
jgi:hypothetical protein